MTDKEALKQSLEALRMPCNYWNKTQFIKVQEAIAAAEKALAQPEERNFCPRCGKRTPDLAHIHTCTPPSDQTIPPGLFFGFMGGEQFMKDSMKRNIT